MRINEIENLVDLVAKTGVSEVTLRTEGRRITIRKAGAPTTSTAVTPPAAARAEEPGANSLSPEMELEETLHWIAAPMVGVFHHAEPPISPGVPVEAGQVVGAIESMKLMNDIRAEISGTVIESLAEAGMAVEYGQPLFGLQAGEG